MATCVFWLCPALLLLVLEFPTTWCNQQKVNFREKEKQVLDQILGPGRYDARIRPSGFNGTDGPAVVRVNIFMRSISKVDDARMEYSVQITFREMWIDERLKFNDFGGKIKYLTLTDGNRVWMPDVFFSNEKEGHFHNIIMPNVYIRIFPYGSVLFSIRTSLTLSCPMDLRLYPMDRQICSMRLASYGWTTDDLVFLWKDGDPVQVVRNLILPYFTLEKFATSYCNSKTNTGEYSCLKVEILFKREFIQHLIQSYFPCCLLVILSWMCFWLDQDAIAARVCLGATTLLTLDFRISYIIATAPPTNYIKAIDVWVWVCMTFVFMALLQTALVSYVRRSDIHRENPKEHRRQVEPIQMMKLEASAFLPLDNDVSWNIPKLRDDLPEETADSALLQEELNKAREYESEEQPKKKHCCRTWLSRIPSRSKRIDVISRIMFPLAFSIFNIVYWYIYLYRVDILQ